MFFTYFLSLIPKTMYNSVNYFSVFCKKTALEKFEFSDKLYNLITLNFRMKKKKTMFYVWISFLLLACVSFSACESDYKYVEEEPDWLGESIYDYLKNKGDFTYYVRIIDSTGYAETLKRTGSKTIFVVKDEAFEHFFSNNSLGIRNFEDFSESQLSSILFSNMLNDTYLLEMLTNISGLPPVKGQAMRRVASLPVLNSVPYETGDDIPANGYWDRFRDKGVHLLKDNTLWTMVYFMESQMKDQGITDDDFYRISGYHRASDDAYIFDAKVIEKDITCKNGYVFVLDKLLLPADNLAEYIRKNQDTRTFSSMLERYSAPYYDQSLTEEYKVLDPEFNDSIFVKRYFNQQEGAAGLSRDPNGSPVDGLLSYDPGRNSYLTNPSASSSLQTDMAAMFIPTDKAMSDYLNGGEGSYLKDRYGSWENVPNNVLHHLINNHMKVSFIASVPSRFGAMEDKMGTPMNIYPDDIAYASVCSNGLAYIMNKVYAPTEYSSVMAPVIFSESARVFNWAISSTGLKFDLYLLSMENKFSFLVPTDEVLNNYINPISVAKGTPERWRFFYNPNQALIQAVAYDAQTGDSLRLITSQDQIKNLLTDIVDNHIVVGDVEDGKSFYKTKGGATVRIGSPKGEGMPIQGGGNIEQDEDVRVTRVHNMSNGKTLFISKTLQTPLNSVYQVLSEHDEYSKFFNLCSECKPVDTGEEIYGGSIFTNDVSFVGLTLNVAFFNTFNYTVYAPTNEAIDEAINTGVIKSWEQIEQIDNVYDQAAEAEKLYQFLRYHFQDNSVYISGEPVDNTFDTACRNTDNDKFRRLKLSGDGSNLKITTENGKSVNVITANKSLYNVMARDYKLNSKTTTSATQISTSSFAVIHQIDGVLTYN